MYFRRGRAAEAGRRQGGGAGVRVVALALANRPSMELVVMGGAGGESGGEVQCSDGWERGEGEC